VRHVEIVDVYGEMPNPRILRRQALRLSAALGSGLIARGESRMGSLESAASPCE
jgi:hypothetical protein